MLCVHKVLENQELRWPSKPSILLEWHPWVSLKNVTAYSLIIIDHMFFLWVKIIYLILSIKNDFLRNCLLPSKNVLGFLYETIWRSIDGVKVKTEEFGLLQFERISFKTFSHGYMWIYKCLFLILDKIVKTSPRVYQESKRLLTPPRTSAPPL